MSKRSNDLVSHSNSKRAKKDKARLHRIQLNPTYFDKSSKRTSNELKTSWMNRTRPDTVTESVRCLTDPFPCWTLYQFITDEDDDGGQSCLNGLQEELMKLKFRDKRNDLYHFKQSKDLKTIRTSHIKQFRELLCEEVLPWLRYITGIELTETVDSTCSKYEYGDMLLCHDDELEGRRIAFIYYLVDPTWTHKDGGTLDIFNTNEHGQPNDIVHSLVPVRNSFLFFEVNPVSFHQVSEVLTSTKIRLSINGWFHGPSVPRPSPYKELIPAACLPLDLPLELLEGWINPMYLDIGIQKQIRDQFENDSQIELPDFLLAEKYKILQDGLQSVEKERKQGPPNRRCIHVIDKGHHPPLDDCLSLLLSDPFCLLLSHFTGLELSSLPLRLEESSQEDEEPNDEGVNPCGCHGNWYHWQPGDYTLMSDADDSDGFVLETRLYFNCDEWDNDNGGYTTYIMKDEDEELLTLVPQSNSLALVYRNTKETLSFTKYINHTSDSSYYSTFTVYHENN